MKFNIADFWEETKKFIKDELISNPSLSESAVVSLVTTKLDAEIDLLDKSQTPIVIFLVNKVIKPQIPTWVKEAYEYAIKEL